MAPTSKSPSGSKLDLSRYSFNQIGPSKESKSASLADFRGHVLLIVNVASQCGFTPQYQGLQKLYDQYRDRKFAVLGFPCNQFGFQEPGEASEIQQFCDLNYKVTFPLFDKIKVNGPDAHPMFQDLKDRAPGLFGIGMIKWNFTKFLVDREGNVVSRFAPQTEPSEIQSEIEKLLKQPEPTI